jgi:hypothetical protein
MGSDRMTRARFGGLIVPGVAASGVLIGHWLTYLVWAPDVGVRDHLLAHTGHGYLGSAVRLAAVLALAAFAVLGARAMRARPTDGRGIDRFVWIVVRMAVVQATVFAAMEILERLAAHQPLGPLFQTGLLALGLMVQVLVAAVGTLVVLWFSRVVQEVARAIRRLRSLEAGSAAPRGIAFAAHGFRPQLAVSWAAVVRGPPSS